MAFKATKKGGSVKKAPNVKAMAKKYSYKSVLSTFKAASSKAKKGKSVKAAVGAKVKQVANIASKANAYGISGADVMSVIGIGGSSSKTVARSGRRHRKGVVPKTVRKWASKFSRRRKQEEKIVKKLFGSDGGKIIKKAKTSRYGSPGVISRSEAMEAMRR